MLRPVRSVCNKPIVARRRVSSRSKSDKSDTTSPFTDHLIFQVTRNKLMAMLSQITSGVIIEVISAIILTVLGFKGVKKIIVINKVNSTGKFPKILIVIGRILFYGFGFYGLSWLASEGFQTKAAIGIGYSLLGLVILCVGKFIRWWNN